MSNPQPRRKVYVTLAQLIEVLMSIDHAQPVGIVTVTEPKMRKTGNQFYGRIMKITEANVFANCDYQDRVNRQLVREGKEANFVAGPRAVTMERRFRDGKPRPVLDKDLADGSHGVYFEVHFYGHLKCEVNYLLDRREAIAKAEFQEFLSERDSASIAAHQGTNSEQIIRTYRVESLREVRLNGVDYVVI
jgi:hypothetical protein